MFLIQPSDNVRRYADEGAQGGRALDAVLAAVPRRVEHLRHLLEVIDEELLRLFAERITLAAGAKRIWIVMEHTTRSGEARLLRRCTYPLTAASCVKRVYTELAVIDVTERGFVVTDMVPGLTIEELQDRTGATLH